MPCKYTFLKSCLILTLTLPAAHSAAAAPVAVGLDGFVTGALGAWDAHNSLDGRGSAYELGGSMAYTGNSGWGGQVDLSSFRQEVDSQPARDPEAVDLAGHIFHRDSGGLIGGFYQSRSYYLYHSYTHTNETFLGFEGQMYLDRMTLQGQFGAEQFDSTYYSDSGYFITGRVNYFVDDNLRLDGGLALIHDGSAGYDYDQSNLELGVEYRVRNSPLSVFATYTHIREDDNLGWLVSSDFTMIGLRFNFGRQTLLERNRSGAGLGTAPRVILW